MLRQSRNITRVQNGFPGAFHPSIHLFFCSARAAAAPPKKSQPRIPSKMIYPFSCKCLYIKPKSFYHFLPEENFVTTKCFLMRNLELAARSLFYFKPNFPTTFDPLSFKSQKKFLSIYAGRILFSFCPDLIFSFAGHAFLLWIIDERSLPFPFSSASACFGWFPFGNGQRGPTLINTRDKYLCWCAPGGFNKNKHVPKHSTSDISWLIDSYEVPSLCFPTDVASDYT